MRYSPATLDAEAIDFLNERHLASLSLVVDADTVHVTPVGFTWDDDSGIARVITFAEAKKVRLIESAGEMAAALSQVDGARWLTLYGRARITADPVACADAVIRYGRRYRPAKDRGADRRTIEITVERISGRA